MDELHLSANPGSASFVPKADAGADLVLRAGESATLGGPGTGGGPWGTNVEYAWVEVDAEGNPVAEAERTEGLSATDAAQAEFTAPALAAERVLRYRLTVQGRGHAGTDAYSASDTVAVTVRAAPAVTAVALTSVPQMGGTYQRGERIEVGVTFSAPVTVTGTPTIGLEVGTEMRQAAYARNAGPAVLLFSYPVASGDVDADGVAVPADGILLAGGTIAGPHGVALLGHDAVAADAAHMVDGSDVAPSGGVCDRTPQVRDALVAAVATASNCSQVGDPQLKLIKGRLVLAGRDIAALKAGDFVGLGPTSDSPGLTGLDLSGNALSALPAGVFDPLTEPDRAASEQQRAGRGRPAGQGVRKAARGADDARPAPEPGQRELRADGRRGPRTSPCGRAGARRWAGRARPGVRGGRTSNTPGSRSTPRATRWRRSRTEGLSATNVARPVFTAPVLTEERVLRYRLTVTGKRARRRAAPSTATVRAPRCRSRSGPARR